jgi:DNA modification methylase
MRRKGLRAAVTPIAGLRPFGRRARTHSPEQIAAIVRSIEAFGFIDPIILDEQGFVLVGWGRVQAAEAIGMREVPYVLIGHLSADQKRAYILAHNKLALLAGWDEELLRLELNELEAAGLDLKLTGFSKDELAELMLPDSGAVEPDECPDVQAEVVTRLGDVWLLGPHRIRCGSSVDKADVDALFNSASPVLMVTDPPYGVNYDPTWRQRAGVSSAGAAKGKVKNDDRADWREAWALFPGNVAYVWHGGLHGATVETSLNEAGFKVRAQIVWVKGRPVISRGHYHWQHEPAFYCVKAGKQDRFRFDAVHEIALYAVKDGERANWRGDRRQTTVWFVDHLKNDTGHGTQKPVECMRRPIVNNSKAGEIVYDPFLGSATTLIAAHMTGRTCYGMELDPAYVDVDVRRWQAFAGLAAVLEGSKGLTFDDVARKRKKHAKPNS